MSHRESKKDLQSAMDIFPNTFSEKVDPLDVEPDFQLYSSRHKLCPCKMFIKESFIRSTSKHGKPSKIPKVYFDELTCTVTIQKHFLNVCKKITESYSNRKWMQWHSVYKKLINANNKQLRNTDSRTCFMVERNHFVVPQAFTFGVRTVAEGTGHLFMTHNIPLQFYQLQSPYKNRIHATTRLFDPTHQNAFYHKRMQPHTCYWVPSETTYIVTALEPAYFAVHLVRSGFSPKFEYKNPLHEKRISVPHGVRPLTMETPNVADERFERFEPSDPVLLAFESGREVRMSSLSSPAPADPPPPPQPDDPPQPADPPPPPMVTVEITQIPLERAVQVVAPEVVRWYADVFQNKMYDNPRRGFECGRSEQDEQPMDLCLPKKTAEDCREGAEDCRDFSEVNATTTGTEKTPTAEECREGADVYSEMDTMVTEKTPTAEEDFSEVDTIIIKKTLTEEEYRDALNSLVDMDAASDWRTKPVQNEYLQLYDDPFDQNDFFSG